MPAPVNPGTRAANSVFRIDPEPVAAGAGLPVLVLMDTERGIASGVLKALLASSALIHVDRSGAARRTGTRKASRLARRIAGRWC